MSIRYRCEEAAIAAPATLLGCGSIPERIGISLELSDLYEVRIIAGPSRVIAQSGQTETETDPEQDNFLSALRYLLELAGAPLAGFIVTRKQNYPRGCGLGDISAAVCAGLLLGRELLGESLELTDMQLLEIAENAGANRTRAAAILRGGAQLFPAPGDNPLALPQVSLPVTLLAPPVSTPQLNLEQLLPLQVTPEAALNQAAAAAALVSALSGEQELLFAGTADYLVAPYLKTHFPASAALLQWLRERKIPAFVTGGGATLATFTQLSEQLQAQAREAGWRVINTSPRVLPLTAHLAD